MPRNNMSSDQWGRRFEVVGTSGRTWIVAINRYHDTWGCSCPAWTMSKSRNADGSKKDCQHIMKVKFEGARDTDGKLYTPVTAVTPQKPTKEKEPGVTRSITFED